MNNVIPKPETTCDDWREHYEANRGLVGWVLSRRFRGLDHHRLEDARQVGEMALMVAARRRDPRRGEFVGYVKSCVRGEILNHLATDSLIRVPRGAGSKPPSIVGVDVADLPPESQPTTPPARPVDDLHPLLVKALCRLSPRQREAIERCVLGDESAADVDRATGRSTTATHRAVALRRLRADLDRMGFSEDGHDAQAR